MAVCLASLLAGGALADVYFSNPSSVNLLERWNSDGTYGLQLEGTFSAYRHSDSYAWSGNYGYNELLRTVLYACHSAGTGMHFVQAGADIDLWVDVTFTFPSPMTVDTFVTSFRDQKSQNPNNYQWLDDKENVLVDVRSATDFTGSAYRTDTSALGPVTTSSVTFRMFIQGMDDRAIFDRAEVIGLGAYLASGQSLAMDGCYNIFYEETNVTGDFDPRWTDHRIGDTGGKPGDAVGKPQQAGSCVWEFSREYELTSMMLANYEYNRYLAEAKLEISDDGKTWSDLWYNEEYHWNINDPFIHFAPDMTARFLKLSWGANSNPVELAEFQLFGKPTIPEPMTMTLLAMGGLALLRRRR